LAFVQLEAQRSQADKVKQSTREFTRLSSHASMSAIGRKFVLHTGGAQMRRDVRHSSEELELLQTSKIMDHASLYREMSTMMSLALL
jgi:hypothetical protein